MIELMPLLKQLAEIGVTPTAAIALAILWKVNNTMLNLDKRLALVEQVTEKFAKC